MVINHGRALLSDIGLNHLTDINTTGLVNIPVAWAYKSPEEINDANGIHSIARDVYSFATLSYTVSTGSPRTYYYYYY